jgi:4-hydroxy-tetrahydrodipicolinate reductase
MKIYLVGANGRMGQTVAKLAPSIAASPKEADAIIDFSSPEGTKSALAAALEYKLPLVVGTTGLPDHLFDEPSTLIPILASPNFSLGIALYLKWLPALREQLPGARCTIIETHHAKKKDAPSGTALKLAEALGVPASIESIREGETIGEHRIILNFEGEMLELRHAALSREAFAKGALAAANFLVNKPAGLYTLADLLI